MMVPELLNIVVQAETAYEVLEYLEDVPKDAAIFFDIDDTIITPVSPTFRTHPYSSIIDDIKANKYTNYINIVSNWRLQRKVMLVDLQWPQVIDRLKTFRPIYALTKMDTGSFGSIPAMAEWRFNELLSLGVAFSENKKFLRHKLKMENGPEFYKGIFLTGSYLKSQVLEVYHHDLKSEFIVMVDDKLDYLDDIRKYCRTNGIAFLGVHFKGVGRLAGEADPAVAEYQKQYLMTHAMWLEDHEVLAMKEK